MCRLATAGDPRFDVSDIEVHRQGPSYTLETVRSLKSLGHAEVHWLIGADQLPRLHTWFRADELLEEAHLWVVRRPGVDILWAELPPKVRALQSRVLTADFLDISSTDIRRRIAAGQPISHLVDPAVEQYIRQHNLYSPSFTG